ncbi:hypothetical protein QR680_015059 [Steinernema hermaphroditum]|uniref:Protein kinase domain-containing protein n=1 Tax=Steinernema hermaphroditum TaxID=289476 RepID=A0AA39M5B1_9BILA|nr:hypothetical protein QR680_015059 [Steinernema hermaphroditum]
MKTSIMSSTEKNLSHSGPVTASSEEAIELPSLPLCPFTLDLQQGPVIMEEVLGQGRFGYVYKASLRKSPVAVKVMKRETDDQMDDFDNEAGILGFLKERHPHIVDNHGWCVLPDNDKLGFIIFDLLPLGSMEAYLQESDCLYHADEGWTIYVQILEGLAYLHSLDIYHRDIKPANILMKTETQVQIADFGLAHYDRFKSQSMVFKNEAGTPSYLPPELYEKGKYFAVYGDLWAATITLLMICNRTCPWTIARNDDQGYRRHCNKAYNDEDIEFWAEFEEHEQMLKAMLNPDADQRLVPFEYDEAVSRYTGY